MKQTVYYDDFVRAFKDLNREDSFSIEALNLIYDYLIDYEENTGGEEIELDVISICGEFSEESILDFANRELDIEDFKYLLDEDDEDYSEDVIYDFSTYSQKIIELSPNIPEDYKEFKIIGNKKVRKKDKKEYYRILLIGLFNENEEWEDIPNPYFITDLDYQYYGLAFTNEEACEIGEQIPVKEGEGIESKEDKSISWGDMDLDFIKEAVQEHLIDNGEFVGFTSDDTVVYSEY